MTPDGKDFEGWLVKFMAFQQKAAKTISQPVPAEVPQLKMAAQDLEPLRAEAEQFAADAIAHYYEAKNLAILKLNFKEWAKSSLAELAKPSCYRQLWGKESAERLAKVISSRAFRISKDLELNGVPR